MKPTLLMFLVITVSLSCNAQQSVSILEGTWKVEGKETYEAWTKTDDGNLMGESYKLKEGTKHVSETLAIKTQGEETIYEATVPNQNQGNTIPFKLNKAYSDGLAFENPAHDFPTKIIYQPEGTDRLLVQVLGADGKGFSYYMDKQ